MPSSNILKRLEALEDAQSAPTHEDGSPILSRQDAEQLTDDQAISETIGAYRSGLIYAWNGIQSAKVSFGWEDPNCDYYIYGTEKASYYWCILERTLAACERDGSALCFVYPEELTRAIELLESGYFVVHRYSEAQRPSQGRKPWCQLEICQAKVDWDSPTRKLADLATKQFWLFADQVEAYRPNEISEAVPTDQPSMIRLFRWMLGKYREIDSTSESTPTTSPAPI